MEVNKPTHGLFEKHHFAPDPGRRFPLAIYSDKADNYEATCSGMAKKEIGGKEEVTCNKLQDIAHIWIRSGMIMR